MLGQSIGDVDDCLWMWYPVEQPLASLKSVFPVLKMLDLHGDVFPWVCSYEESETMDEVEGDH